MLDTSPIEMQRAKGRGLVRFGFENGCNKLIDLHQSGCLKLLLPRNFDQVPDAVMINTAGGLTGCDQLSLFAEVEDGASLRIATQTAERIYQSTGASAQVQIEFKLGQGAQLDWLAQETILFDRGRVERKIEVDMAIDSSLLLVEPIVLGRAAMGEQVHNGLIHDHWRIMREGKLCFAESAKFDNFDKLKDSAALGAATALATVLFVDETAPDRIESLRDWSDCLETKCAMSAWNGQLIMRLLDENPRRLRNSVVAIIEKLRGRPAPRVWTM